MKMNNQGLEALAALASAAPSTATNRGTGDSANGSGAERGGSREASGAAASVGSETGSATAQATQAATHAEQPTHPAQLAQWQQLMSNLAASGGNPNVMASNASGGLGLLSGMQSAPPTDNSSLMMAMQNMAHYQLMAQAQAQAQAQAASQNQLSALSNLAAQLSRTNPQASGLGLSLQNPFSSLLKGKFIVLIVMRLRDQRKRVDTPPW